MCTHHRSRWSRCDGQKVSFCPNPTQISGSISNDENWFPDDGTEVSTNQIWYSKAELSRMKKEVGSLLIRRIFAESHKQHDDDDHQSSPELWGLERHCPQRDQAKKSTIKVVIMAQHLDESKRDPHFLSSISRQCSEQARALAAEQGFRDSCHSYYEDSLAALVDDCISDIDMPSYCLSSGCKRSAAEIDLPGTHEQRVRKHHVSAA